MSFSEPAEWTEQRRQRLAAAWPELNTTEPDDLFHIDAYRVDNQRPVSDVSQMAMRVARYAVEPTNDQPDTAPNVDPWTPQADTNGPDLRSYDPYSTEALSTPAMPPPQSYYQGAASWQETARNLGRTFYESMDTLGFKGPATIAIGGLSGARPLEIGQQEANDLAQNFAIGSLGNGPHLPGASGAEGIESVVARLRAKGLTPAEAMHDPEFMALQAQSGFMPDYNATPADAVNANDITVNLRRARESDARGADLASRMPEDATANGITPNQPLSRADEMARVREEFAARNPAPAQAARPTQQPIDIWQDRVSNIYALQSRIKALEEAGDEAGAIAAAMQGLRDHVLTDRALGPNRNYDPRGQITGDLGEALNAVKQYERPAPTSILERARAKANEPRLPDTESQQQAIRAIIGDQPPVAGASDLPGRYVPTERALSQAEQIIREKPDVTSEQAQGLLGSLDLWMKQADSIRKTIPETTHERIAQISAHATGNLADSYLTALYQRKEWAEAALKAQGVPEDLAKQASQRLINDQLKLRYPGGIPERIQAEIAKTGAVGDDTPATIAKGAAALSQEWKNLAFGPMDVGVFGQQVLHAGVSSPGQILAGTVNRVLNLAGAGLETTLLDKTALAKRLQYQLDGVPQNVSTGIVQDARQGLLGQLGTDKYNVGKLVDASTRFQFGTVLGGLRNLIHEGNLVALHLAGQDITNPAVRATAAEFANSSTSWAPRALNAKRALAESATMMTPSMRRAQVTSILQMGKVLTPSASPAERLLAATTILSLAGANLAVGKLVANAIGTGDYEFDPSKKGWGQIATDVRNSAGQRIVTALFPQEQVATTILKSIRELAEHNPQEAAKEWAKLFMGTSGPALQAVEKAAGYGYQPGKGYRYGDLNGGLLNVLPLPPIMQSYLQGELSPQTAPFEVTGLPAYTEFPTNAVKRGEYATLKGEPQLDAVDEQGWNLMQRGNGAPEAVTKAGTYYDWRRAQYDRLTTPEEFARAAAAGVSRGEVIERVNSQIDKSPIAKLYEETKGKLRDRWVEQHPQLALDLNSKYEEMKTLDEKMAHSSWNLGKERIKIAHQALGSVPSHAAGGLIGADGLRVLAVEDIPWRTVRKVVQHVVRNEQGKMVDVDTEDSTLDARRELVDVVRHQDGPMRGKIDRVVKIYQESVRA